MSNSLNETVAPSPYRFAVAIGVGLVIAGIWLLGPLSPLNQVVVLTQVGFVAHLFCFSRMPAVLRWGLLFGAMWVWQTLSPNTILLNQASDPFNYALAKLLLLSILANWIFVAVLCLFGLANWSWWKFSIWQLVVMIAGVSIVIAGYREPFLSEIGRPLPPWEETNYFRYYFKNIVGCWTFLVIRALGFAAVGIPFCYVDKRKQSYAVAILLGTAVFTPLLRYVGNYLMGRQLDVGIRFDFVAQFVILVIFTIQLCGVAIVMRLYRVRWQYAVDADGSQ